MRTSSTSLSGRIAARAVLAAVAWAVVFCALACPRAYAVQVGLGGVGPNPDEVAQTAHAYGSQASAEGESAADDAQSPTTVEKSEVVYGMLAADGTPKEIYVVNRFVASQPCRVHDFGAYSLVANLSTTQELTCANGEVAFDVGDDPFFYQGSLEKASLPWDVRIAYTLNGRAVAPDELAGASGALVITVNTKANAQVNPAFYESFMLQVTFTLDGNLCTDIQAKGATMAASGKDQTVAFTALPGHDGSFALSAQVKDFQMASVQIAALPYTNMVDMPDTGEMEDGIGELSDAISQLDAGTRQLADGVAQLSSGAASLAEGSEEFGDGLERLAASSTQIVGASAQINTVLSQIADALEGVDLSNIDELAQYSGVLREIADTLEGLKVAVRGMDDGYARMAEALDDLAAIAYENGLSEDEIAALREAVADDEEAAASLEKLLASYYALRAALDEYYANGGSPETLEGQIEEFFRDGGQLDEAVHALRTAAEFLEDGGLDQVQQLVGGMSELASGYEQFHAGLVAYTQGVQTLSENYGALSSGASQLASGTSQLADGASQLSSGIAQLDAGTRDLPAQMRQRIDELMADFDFPAFDPVSFVDERNQDVVAVQFVLLTDAIEVSDEALEQADSADDSTMWDRFLALFQ